MHDKLKKILGKKRDLKPAEKHAKMHVLKHMRDEAAGEMGHKLGSLKKVSVMSDSKEGLEKGLDKAKQVVSTPEMERMLDHSENPYGDAQSAMEEHSGDHQNQEAQYSEGGEVETPDKGEYGPQDQESPAEEESEEQGEEGHEELEGLDLEEIQKRIDHLMELHKKLSEK